MMGDEIGDQPVEQGLIAGRVGDPQVVLGIDQSPAEEIAPDPVDDGFGEVRIVGPSQPIREDDATVARVIRGDRRAIQRPRRHRHAATRMKDLPLTRAGHHLVAGGLSVLELDPGEQIGKAVILILCPFLERMIVTASAHQRQAEKRHARAFGQVDRIAVQHEEVDRSVRERAPLGRHDRAGKLVPRNVFRHALAHKSVERPHRRRGQPSRRDQQEDPTTCTPSSRRTQSCRATGRPAWRVCPGDDP